jgi:hypothetical protein
LAREKGTEMVIDTRQVDLPKAATPLKARKVVFLPRAVRER